MNRKQNGTMSAGAVRRLMAGACMAAGLMVSGCDADVLATQEAKTKSAEAARYVASAGQPRATEKLYDRVAGTDDAGIGVVQNDVDGKVKKDVQALNEWVIRNTAVKDLETAQKKIAEAISAANGAEVDAAVKSTLQAQSGTTNLQLAAARLEEARKKLTQLVDLSNQLSGLTTQAVVLGSEADAIAKVKPAAVTSEVDGARKVVSEREETLAKAKAAVEEVKAQIKAKQEEAKKIYGETEAQFVAAESLKGQEAIDAVNKAGEARKAADTATAEAGNLEPKLSQAEADARKAEAMLEEGKALLATKTGAVDVQAATAKRNLDRVNSLRQQAKKLVEEDKVGINARYKELTGVAAELEKDLESAKAAASKAQADYAAALAENGKSLQKLKTMVSERELDPKDPMTAAAKEERVGALLTWSQASAVELAGRIHASNYATGRLLSLLTKEVVAANKAAGMNSDAKEPTNIEQSRKEAVEAFTRAAELAASGVARGGTEVKNIAWIGYGVQFLANHGLMSVSEGAVASKAKAEAKALYDKAIAGDAIRGPLEREVFKIQ